MKPASVVGLILTALMLPMTAFGEDQEGNRTPSQAAQAAFDRGIELAKAQEHEQAYDAFTEALEAHPEFIEAYERRARSARRLAAHAESQDDKDALALRSMNDESRARTLRLKQEADQELQILETALNRGTFFLLLAGLVYLGCWIGVSVSWGRTGRPAKWVALTFAVAHTIPVFAMPKFGWMVGPVALLYFAMVAGTSRDTSYANDEPLDDDRLAAALALSQSPPRSDRTAETPTKPCPHCGRVLAITTRRCPRCEHRVE